MSIHANTESTKVTQLRKRLSEISGELHALPNTAFAQKHKLNTESDLLKEQLHELLSNELDGVGDEWAERSGRKASHTIDYGVRAAVAVMRIGDGGR